MGSLHCRVGGKTLVPPCGLIQIPKLLSTPKFLMEKQQVPLPRYSRSRQKYLKKYLAPLATRNPTANFSWMLSWHLAIRTKPSVDNKIRVKLKVAQLCLTLCDPMDCIVHGILQARILEWVAFPFSRESSKPRSSALQADSSSVESSGKPKNTGVGSLSLLQWIFSIQELNRGLLHCRQTLYQLSYQFSSVQSLSRVRLFATP